MDLALTDPRAGNRSGGPRGTHTTRPTAAGNRDRMFVTAGLGNDVGIQTRRAELRIPAGLTFDSWRHIGCNLTMISNSSGWWLGDWLVYGENRFPERYRVVLDETTLDYKTLRNYAWVARRFPPSRRRETLSLQHHAEVAALPKADQDRWLKQAEREKWSTRRLRKELRQTQGTADEAPTDTSIKFVLSLDAGRKDLWTHAAAAVGMPLQDWMAKVLDEAAVAVE
ncbi:LmbU family transcriptional regulator [Streptomyces longispororuber]|uniref:LmbU family transcriptional regulator n=1 Tax=Streptomyces longispororuber TaxID=68230 RepID=UPI0037023149